MKKYKFLIVTPSYNQGEFIKETITSVIRQDIELKYIIMDGGSTDNTTEIVKKFKKPVQFFSEKDNGQTDAINKGIEYFSKNVKENANVEYIFAYINSDDYYSNGAFTTVVQEFEAHNEKMWLVGEYTIDTDKNLWFHTLLSTVWKRLLKKIYSKNLLLIANPIAQPATFIRWDAIKNTGLFNDRLRYVMDYEYWLRLQDIYGDPLFVDTQLASFRIHQTSKGGFQFKQQFAEQYEVAKKFTTNRVILGLHKLHNWLTITLYFIMK